MQTCKVCGVDLDRWKVMTRPDLYRGPHLFEAEDNMVRGECIDCRKFLPDPSYNSESVLEFWDRYNKEEFERELGT